MSQSILRTKLLNMEKKQNKYSKYQCACCGYYTVLKEHDLCPVCFWEEDWYQEQNPLHSSGANSVSLIEAKENYAKYLACEEDYKKLVRLPHTDERL